MLDCDFHNFNKKCFVESSFIKKPRSIFCEYQVYSRDSQFRNLIDKLTDCEFKLLPYLKCKKIEVRPTLQNQEIEFLELKAISRRLIDSEIVQIGGIIALMNVLGVGDLHKTNILFGEKSGELFFAPIDLEIFFQSFLYERLGLAPSGHEHIHCCSGISHFINYLKNYPDQNFSAKLIFGYEKYLTIFLQHQSALYEALFAGYNRDNLPTRVLLKPTIDYVDALKSKDFSGFYPEELSQMRRGDIPYFFKLLDASSEIFYWRDERQFVAIDSVVTGVSVDVAERPQLLFKPMMKSFFLICRDLDSVVSPEASITSYQDVKVIHQKRFKIVSTNGLLDRVDSQLPTVE